MTITPKRACDWKAGVTQAERASFHDTKQDFNPNRGGYIKKPFEIMSPDGTIYKGECIKRWVPDHIELFARLRLPSESLKDFEKRVYRNMKAVIGSKYVAGGQWNGWTLAGNRIPVKWFIVRRKNKFVHSFSTREAAQEFISSRPESGYIISTYRKLI